MNIADVFKGKGMGKTLASFPVINTLGGNRPIVITHDSLVDDVGVTEICDGEDTAKYVTDGACLIYGAKEEERCCLLSSFSFENEALDTMKDELLKMADKKRELETVAPFNKSEITGIKAKISVRAAMLGLDADEVMKKT